MQIFIGSPAFQSGSERIAYFRCFLAWFRYFRNMAPHLHFLVSSNLPFFFPERMLSPQSLCNKTYSNKINSRSFRRLRPKPLSLGIARPRQSQISRGSLLPHHPLTKAYRYLVACLTGLCEHRYKAKDLVETSSQFSYSLFVPVFRVRPSKTTMHILPQILI